MRYLVSVIDDKSDPGSTDRRPAISAFNERLIAEGYWVFAGGLADTDAATVIDNRGEQAVFSDGPFVESKEYLAGVWVWEAPIWMWRSSWQPRRRRSAIGRSRCGRSCEQDRRPRKAITWAHHGEPAARSPRPGPCPGRRTRVMPMRPSMDGAALQHSERVLHRQALVEAVDAQGDLDVVLPMDTRTPSTASMTTTLLITTSPVSRTGAADRCGPSRARPDRARRPARHRLREAVVSWAATARFDCPQDR